jgi:hypothetical protein
MPIIVGGVTKRAMAPTQLLEKLPTPDNRRFNEANRRQRSVLDRTIVEYHHSGVGSGVDHGDMISMLLLARDEETGEGLSNGDERLG